MPDDFVIEGKLDIWYETGSEGVVWLVEPDTVPDGYDPKHFFYYGMINAGHHLVITDPTGKEVFSGMIDPDEEIGWEPYPLNPSHGSPCALGYRIHWTQRGFQPDDWARFFLPKKGEPSHRGRLTRSTPPKP